MRTALCRFLLFSLLMFGFQLSLLSGPGSVPGNSVDFDPPPKGGANPDSPAVGAITATGFTKDAVGWKCASIEVTVKELPTLKQVDYQVYKGAATWKYAGNNFTSQVTHTVAVQAVWFDQKRNADTATAAQTVTVK